MPNRGEVWFARLDPTEGSEQRGERPVVIVSDNALTRAGMVIVVPCTSQRHTEVYAGHVLLPRYETGLELDSVALADQVRAISTQRLSGYRGTLSQKAMMDVEDALLLVLGIQ